MFPRAELGIWPTPIERLARTGKRLSRHDLFIKRDDLTGLGLGGNKTRSLEFLLGDAVRNGADTIITAGGLQSNLCALTAAACCKIGLRCFLLHNDEAPTEPRGNMLLNSIFGAESVFIGKVDEAKRASEMEDLAGRLRDAGRKPYIIHNGASTPLGAIGYVNAALELHRQIGSGGPDIKHVAIVGAMGGTAGGFVLGTALLGHPFHVHVISVEYPKPVLKGMMESLLRGASELIRKAGGAEPAVPPQDVMTLYDDYLGDGYAVPTPLSRRTLFQFPRSEGILVEDVYTSKCLGGFLDLAERGVIPRDESALYIHTGGLGALFAQDVGRP